MRHFISLIALASIPAAAPAASWTFAANCGSGDQVRAYSYDPKSIRRAGASAIVEVMGDYSRIAGSRASEARMSWAFHCPSRTFVEQSRVEYGPGRKVVANYAQPTGHQSISENGVAARLYNVVCA